MGSIPTGRAMNIIVSDFDDTLFKRNHGLIEPNVRYLEQRALPVYIVTYRGPSQFDFLTETLAETKINIIGYAFADSRKKDPSTKLVFIDALLQDHNIVEALDDDESLVLPLGRRGIKMKHTGVAQ